MFGKEGQKSRFLTAFSRTLEIINTPTFNSRSSSPDGYGLGRVTEAILVLGSFCTTIRTEVGDKKRLEYCV